LNKNFKIKKMSIKMKGKKILLGITGSIAAYKSPMLIREFIKAGVDVKVIITPSAREFVSTLTLANLSRNEVICDMFDNNSQTSGAWHIKYAHDCDVMLIAPCSATSIGKIANAICDSALVSVAIALPPEIPLVISPAMDSTMWLHPATQRSLELVKQDGAIIIPPVDGDLSSGFVGPGRFPEIEDIVKFVEKVLAENQGKKRYEQTASYTKTKANVNNSNEKIFNEKPESKPEPEPKPKTINEPKPKPENVKINFENLNRSKIDDERFKHLIDSPIQSLEDAVTKDKFNAELEFEALKKRMT
jgi:3-polyprenyl-4-hydroxybenzoate decarboxylase